MTRVPGRSLNRHGEADLLRDTSLDGFVEDADGRFDWAAPDDEMHAFVNDLERPIGMYLHRYIDA
jgi:hypothetical protein